MEDIPLIDGIERLAQRYDAMLCDAWGVIHDGMRLFPGAADALTRFRKARGPVVIVTNAPKPSFVIPAQLDRLGLPRDAYDAVVTSGDATRAAIAAHLPAPAHRIGPAWDDPLFEGMSIDFRPLAEADFIVCTGLNDDDRDEPEHYRDMLRAGADRGLPMICANPDIVVRWGGRLRWCAGAIAEIYKELGGDVIYGGKPHAPIYEIARAKIAAAKSGAARFLAVGDGLNTDIRGANNQGVDALFITGDGGVHDGAKDAASLMAQMKAAGVRAVAAAERLQW
ncbi:MAG: TIGR01459 family HAD-type hydrolase [Parvularculaceae bacterium]